MLHNIHTCTAPFEIQCLAQGHLGMLTAGVRDQTTDPLIHLLRRSPVPCTAFRAIKRIELVVKYEMSLYCYWRKISHISHAKDLPLFVYSLQIFSDFCHSSNIQIRTVCRIRQSASISLLISNYLRGVPFLAHVSEALRHFRSALFARRRCMGCCTLS